MRPVELSLDVSGARARPGAARIAATAYLPEAVSEPLLVVFASPGAGYARGYFDMRFEGREGYSQAEHHTARGIILVAYDHLGVGDSSIEGLAEMSMGEVADADHAAVVQVVEALRTGELDAGLAPLPDVTATGHGQSMGAAVTMIMQARH